jgi:transcriptional regulator with XRE-family HTH domain
MKLGEKLRYLREVEGTLRGYGRALTQLDVVAAVKREIGATISQSYLSQIENGARPHLGNATRMLLARFFRVHPGYLVDDPEGYHTELVSDLRAFEDTLDLWLVEGAERFGKDGELAHALLDIARCDDSRSCLLLLGAILETPNLAERLLQVLKPERMEGQGAEGPKVRPSAGSGRREHIERRRSEGPRVRGSALRRAQGAVSMSNGEGPKVEDDEASASPRS